MEHIVVLRRVDHRQGPSALTTISRTYKFVKTYKFVPENKYDIWIV